MISICLDQTKPFAAVQYCKASLSCENSAQSRGSKEHEWHIHFHKSLPGSRRRASHLSPFDPNHKECSSDTWTLMLSNRSIFTRRYHPALLMDITHKLHFLLMNICTSFLNQSPSCFTGEDEIMSNYCMKKEAAHYSRFNQGYYWIISAVPSPYTPPLWDCAMLDLNFWLTNRHPRDLGLIRFSAFSDWFSSSVHFTTTKCQLERRSYISLAWFLPWCIKGFLDL